MKPDRAEVEEVKRALEAAELFAKAGLSDEVPVPVRGETLRKLYRIAMAVMDAPVARVEVTDDAYEVSPSDGDSYAAIGKLHCERVRLVRVGEE